jgi:hypothetical protein
MNFEGSGLGPDFGRMHPGGCRSLRTSPNHARPKLILIPRGCPGRKSSVLGVWAAPSQCKKTTGLRPQPFPIGFAVREGAARAVDMDAWPVSERKFGSRSVGCSVSHLFGLVLCPLLVASTPNIDDAWGPYSFIGFGAMDVTTKPYEFHAVWGHGCHQTF